jgi:4-amino-4-deoxy-L-arabinose transferase-like glycosyltransferase
VNTPFLPRNTYLFLFSLLGVVYIIGLFVPLMDNDSAHHGIIALRMYLTGDYINLIDNGKDYLDKPHLHFWLCAASYKVFGVTTFAYKFPSFLFTIGGVYSVYKLGKALYDKETGKLAALIIASAFAFILANNDVRMDAILTASTAFATWQGVLFIQNKKIINAIGLAAGLAIGFCTKGHIAVFVPAIGLFFYILYKKEWKLFYNWKWLVSLLCFAIFISPVVYCFYLQYNLHPETVVRGKDHINGVRFILLNQSIERLTGEWDASSKKDFFFFFHSFLWAFAPWAFIGYWAVWQRLKGFLKRENEWLSISTFIIFAVIVGASGFKLPHYLNIAFPVISVLIAFWILQNRAYGKKIYYIQAFASAALLLLSFILNGWFFPVSNFLVISGMVICLAVVFHFLMSKVFTQLQKAVCLTTASAIVFFFLYNSNFSPKLIKYQCGNELAKKIKGVIDPEEIYFWKDNYSSSFNFYTATLRKQFNDSLFNGRKKSWVLFSENEKQDVLQSGYQINQQLQAADYEVSRYNFKFLNPATRDSATTQMILAEISRKQ